MKQYFIHSLVLAGPEKWSFYHFIWWKSKHNVSPIFHC